MPTCYVRSDKKSRFSIIVIIACIIYVCLGREKVIHTEKEEGEKIKIRHDERKKVSLQTTSSDSLHCMNSSLNIF
jgi:hypothetical protein